jgi:hypothetical protein
MCVLASTALGLTSLAVGIAGAVTTGIAQQEQANAAENAANQRAKAVEHAMIVESQNAQSDAVILAFRQRAARGAAQNRMAATGSQINFGSYARASDQTAKIQSLEQANLAYNAASRIQGLGVQASGFRTDAANYAKAGQFAVAGTALSGVAGVAAGAFRLADRGAFGRLDRRTDDASLVNLGSSASRAQRYSIGTSEPWMI